MIENGEIQDKRKENFRNQLIISQFTIVDVADPSLEPSWSINMIRTELP